MTIHKAVLPPWHAALLVALFCVAVPTALSAAPGPGITDPADGLPSLSERTAATDEMAAIAVETLARRVLVQSHPTALRQAFQAYFRYRRQHPDEVRKPYLYYVDFGLPSTEPRGYVFDMDAMVVLDGPFTVAHGRGSIATPEGVPASFSNQPGSNATSLGLFLAAETYDFRGTASGRGYTSIGLRMEGLSAGFNSNARRRGVVAHGAPYVTPSQAGRSEGCPAMEQARAEWLLPLLSQGSLVFLFSSTDREWMRLDRWNRMEARRLLPDVPVTTRV